MKKLSVIILFLLTTKVVCGQSAIKPVYDTVYAAILEDTGNVYDTVYFEADSATSCKYDADIYKIARRAYKTWFGFRMVLYDWYPVRSKQGYDLTGKFISY